MTFPSRPILVGTGLACAAAGFWLLFRPSPSAASAPRSPAAALPRSGPPSGPTHAPAVRGAADQAAALDQTLADFAAKLHALQQVQTGDDATAGRLRRELLAYVNAQNVEDLARSLSASELDTPFGLDLLQFWIKTAPLDAAAWLGAQNQTEPSPCHVGFVATALAGRPEDSIVLPQSNKPLC